MSELSNNPSSYHEEQLDDQRVIETLADAIMKDPLLWNEDNSDGATRMWPSPYNAGEHIALHKRDYLGFNHQYLSIYMENNEGEYNGQFIEGFCISDKSTGIYAVDEYGVDADDPEIDDPRDLDSVVRGHLETAPIEIKSVLDELKIATAFWRIATSYALNGYVDTIRAAVHEQPRNQVQALERVTESILSQDYGLSPETVSDAVYIMAKDISSQNQL